ncbi:MAG TPA: hypothetical protein ENJ27_02330 [Candidatus Moranbacteria bacterium]|nr:hypothetical protein [Candidatus Moranbacteria bacterium]
MKEKDNKLIKIEQDIAKRAEFYINSPERAGEALLFAKQLTKFAEKINKKIREKATKIMEEQNIATLEYDIVDPNTGEVKSWEIRKQESFVSKKYRPENVFSALGKKAFNFFNVKKGELEKYLKEKSYQGEIPIETVEEATKNPTEKTYKGRIVIREIK